MARPKSILWVDDEVEGLAPHRRFLEEQGFTVAAAAHGDDALAMLRRQPYSVVLLDEQMPGRRGLDLLPEIRAIDAGVAVVMVTQSEDEGTLRDAIGVAVDDYLVKPVHPRQILPGAGAVHRRRLPAARPVGGAARSGDAAVRRRGVPLLQHPADRDAVRAQRDLLRAVPDGDRRATPRLVGPGLGRREPQRA